MTIAASGNYIAGTILAAADRAGHADLWLARDPYRHRHRLQRGDGVLLLVLRPIMGGSAAHDHSNAPPPRVDLGIPTNALTVMLCIASISCCVAMSMPQVHIVSYCGDLGYGVARGAEMLALMLAFGIISRIGSGFIADRFGGMVTLLIGSVAQAVALFFYLFFTGLPSLYVVSAMFGLFQGGIVPSYAIIVRETMPANEAATRVGIVIMVSVVGMSFGGWVSGVIFDATGSYAAAFINGVVWNALNIGDRADAVAARPAAAGDGVRTVVRNSPARGHGFRDQGRDRRSARGKLHLHRTEDHVRRQAHRRRRYHLLLRERERRRAGPHRARRRHLGQAIPRKRHRPADAAREHHRPAHRAAKRRWAERAETVHRLEDGRPETELNFKFYRQATNKIVGISDERRRSFDSFRPLVRPSAANTP